MIKPLVSVIIPVYNAEKYLAQAIRSALDQTWPNVEIIAINNGSTDNSLTIARSFEKDGVKVFTQQNKGASAARNKGLQKVKGAYIQFLDADDLISPNKIEAQMKLLQNKPGYICTCPTIHFVNDEDPSDKKPEHIWMSKGSDDPVDFLVKLYGGGLIGPQYGGMIAVHSWLCPKTILDEAGTWNETLSVNDDGEYFCRVILAAKGILYASEAINYYRKHDQYNSLSGLRTEKGFQSAVDAIDLKYKHVGIKLKDKDLFNQIFATLYADAAVSTYPAFKKLSAYALNKAKQLWPNIRPVYKAGPVSNFLISVFGWRPIRAFNYYRYKL